MKKIFFFAIFLMSVNCIQSQTTRFNRMYHLYPANVGVGNRFNQIVQKDNQYIAFGHYAPNLPGFPTNYMSVMAAKTDSLGDIISWVPYLDTAYNYMLSGWSSDVQTIDGGYIINGQACENISPYTYNGFLMKLDSNLNMLWRKHYHDTSISTTWTYPDYAFQSLKVTPDNGFIAVGIRYKNSGLSCCLAVKYDSLGNQQWLKTYNENNYWSNYNTVIVLPDGYVFGGGVGPTSDVNSNDDVITKVDFSGNVIWQKMVGGTKGGEWITLQNHPDNSIISLITKCDSAYTSGTGDYEGFLTLQFYKLSAATGDTTWSLSYGPKRHNNICRSFRVFSDGSILASGAYGYLTTPWLLHLTAEGEVDWYREYKVTSVNENYFSATPFDFQQTRDKGYVVCGQIRNTDTINGNCGWILKLDEHGCFQQGCDSASYVLPDVKITSSLELYPNPATTEVTVSFFRDLEKGSLEIYNTMGVQLMEIPLPKGKNSHSFSVAKLASGLYKLVLKDKEYVRGQASLIITN
ncbi:MAG: T9SS type A sorting domain-containing protein [Bacteroidota bacterium]